VSAGFQDELLQVQECSLVRHLLPNLDLGSVCVVGVTSLTIFV
jgi:hypothetical protein